MLKRLHEAGKETHVKGFVFLAIVITIIVMSHAWNAYCWAVTIHF